VALDKTKLIKLAAGVNFLSVLGFSFAFLFQLNLARKFGVSYFADAYVGASTIPFAIVATMSSLLEKTFIPVFFEHRLKNDIWKSIYNFISVYFLFLCCLVAAGYAGAAFVIKLTLPGFTGEAYYLALRMLKILLPTLLFGGLIGIFVPVYYAHERFILPNILPSIKWIIAIAFMLFFKERYGIFSVAIGMLFGHFVHFFMLFLLSPDIRKIKFRIDFKNPLFLSVLLLMWPLLMSGIFNNFSIIVMRGVSSNLGEGSVSSIGYAYNIMSILVFMCVQGISVVLFPLFSKLGSENNIPDLKRLFISSQRILFIIISPVITGLIVFRYPIIKLLFERGAFDSTATFKIANLIFAFSGAFIALSIGTIQSQIYYALKNTKRVMFITLIQMILFFAIMLVLNKHISVYSIGISFSAAIFIGCFINYFHLSKKLSMDIGKDDILFAFKISAAVIAMSFLSVTVFNLLRLRFANLLLIFPVVTMLAAAVYFLILYSVFRVQELRLVLKMALQKRYELQ
jgi:putative peptidoglycan lipid II flippase